MNYSLWEGTAVVEGLDAGEANGAASAHNPLPAKSDGPAIHMKFTESNVFNVCYSLWEGTAVVVCFDFE